MKLIKSDLENCLRYLIQLEESGEYILSRGSSSLTEVVKSFSNNPQFQIFQYFDDQENCVGIISTFPNSNKDTISLGITYILPDYRGFGYGYKIRKDFLKLLKDQGYKKVFTKTWESNEPMIYINKKMGFKKVGVKKDDRINGDSTVKFLYEFDE